LGMETEEPSKGLLSPKENLVPRYSSCRSRDGRTRTTYTKKVKLNKRKKLFFFTFNLTFLVYVVRVADESVQPSFDLGNLLWVICSQPG